MVEGICWHCGNQLENSDYARENRCPSCDKATHCCLNCRFYQKGRSNDCYEPIAEHVSNKTKANFCDYFEPGKNTYHTSKQDSEELNKAAEDLFNL